MTRIIARPISSALVAFAVLGAVTFLGSAPANAIEEYDGGDYWDQVVAPAFERDGAIGSGLDNLYSFVFGDPTQGFTLATDGSIVTCTVGVDPDCTAPLQGYAPSPAGVGTMFFTRTAAAGVTVKSGNSLVTAAGLAADLTGVASGVVTVDQAETDLTVAVGGVAGFPGGVNTKSHGPNSFGETGVATVDVLVAPSYNSTAPLKVRVTWAMPSGIYVGQSQIVAHFTDGTSTGIGAGNCDYRFVPCTPLVADRLTGWTVKPISHVTVSFSAIDGMTASSLTWYPLGHTLHDSALGGMVGSVDSTYSCRTPSGSSRSMTTSVPVASTEALTDVPLEAFECEADELLESALVEWVTDTGRETIYDYEAPSWIQDTPAEWQDCGTKNCELKLYKEGAYCGENAVGCADWWEQDPDGYTCKFGSHAVSLDYCSMFRNPGSKSPSGKVKVDTDTGELVYEGPAGKPREWFDTLPKAGPASPATPIPDPTGVPDPVKPGFGDPSSTTGRCFPSGWGLFNPLEWVYRPVTCALTWAFVPRQAVVQSQLTIARTAVDDHGVLGVVPAAIDVPGQVAAGWSGSCSGGLLDINVETSAGELQAGLPCSPSEVAPGFGGTYNTFRTFLIAVTWASCVWGVFITVRAYFGGRDA